MRNHAVTAAAIPAVIATVPIQMFCACLRLIRIASEAPVNIEMKPMTKPTTKPATNPTTSSTKSISGSMRRTRATVPITDPTRAPASDRKQPAKMSPTSELLELPTSPLPHEPRLYSDLAPEMSSRRTRRGRRARGTAIGIPLVNSWPRTAAATRRTRLGSAIAAISTILLSATVKLLEAVCDVRCRPRRPHFFCQKPGSATLGAMTEPRVGIPGAQRAWMCWAQPRQPARNPELGSCSATKAAYGGFWQEIRASGPGGWA
jgi:hypothetical protein